MHSGREKYMYPFGDDTLAKVFEELIPREDYEFYVVRSESSNEILGWMALSFEISGNKAENKAPYEAKLEWTEMYSNILKMWKIDGAGRKANVGDMIKRTSTDLQAKHLPRNHCIINALVLYPGYIHRGLANILLMQVIEFWKNRAAAGTEWAIWVQAPCFLQGLYKTYSFEEVREYTVDAGANGFFPQATRTDLGIYAWHFLVLKGIGETISEEPNTY